MNKNRRLQSVYGIVNGLEFAHCLQDLYPSVPGRLSFAWTAVRLPDRPDKDLTLLSFLDPEKAPVALLTNERVPSPKKAARLIVYYLARYAGCEDPIRFLKQTFRLEKFLLEQMPSVRKWFFWISVAFTLLFDFHTQGEILRKIIDSSKPFPKKVRFHYYRILRGINYLLRDFFPYACLARAKIH